MSITHTFRAFLQMFNRIDLPVERYCHRGVFAFGWAYTYYIAYIPLKTATATKTEVDTKTVVSTLVSSPSRTAHLLVT